MRASTLLREPGRDGVSSTEELVRSGRRIAFFLPSLGGGGAQRMIVNLATVLDRRKIPLDLVLAHKEGPYLSEVPPGVRIIDLGTRLRSSVFKLAAYLRRERPGVVMSTLTSASNVLVLARMIARVDTPVVIRQASFIGPNQPRLPLLRWCYSRADRFIALSDVVAEDLITRAMIDPRKVVTIPNPAYTPDLASRAGEHVDHPWFVDRSAPILVGVGRLHPAKGFKTLIRALAIIRESTPCRLAILGEGDQREELEGLCRELGVTEDVWMPGFVKNPFKYMAQADVFVLSSVIEPFGNVLVEALSVGAPVVSTADKTAAPEILEQGRWGRLVPGKDPHALAEAVLKTLREPGPSREELMEYATSFDAERICDRYLQALGVPAGSVI